MGTQLLFLVKSSNDPQAAYYALAHLSPDGLPLECQKSTVKHMRTDIFQHIAQLAWNPNYVRHRRPRSEMDTALRDAGKTRLEDVIKKQQLEVLLKQQQRYQEMTTAIWRDLASIDEALVRQRLTDADPLLRMMALQFAGRRRLPVTKEAIALLADPYPDVRQAARQTLVRLGRGVDFGPEPTASLPQIALSIQHWNAWLALQQDAPDRNSPEKK